MSDLQPKKSAKVKPRAPVSSHPCGGSPGSTSTRHHHRLFRSLHHLNHSQHLSPQLPPIADHKTIESSSPSAAAASAHLHIPRRASPSIFSSSCYMLHEEEPWETCPAFAKIRPPPKVSRLDIGSTRLMRDCVYPQLPPLCTRGPPEAVFDPAEPSGEAVGLGLLDEGPGLVAPTQAGASFGELSDPLSLDVSSQVEGGCRSLEVAAQHQLPLSPSPLSTWTLGKSDSLTSRADRAELGTSFQIGPSSPLPTTSSRLLPQPFDSTLSCLQDRLQAQSSAPDKPSNTSPHTSAVSSSSHASHVGAVKAEASGRRPEQLSKAGARSITKLVNRACKDPLGIQDNSELLASVSTRATDSRRSRDGLGDSVGLAVALPPSAALGQGSHGSRLPSITTNRLLQEGLIRPVSPLHRAASSYMVSIICFLSTLNKQFWCTVFLALSGVTPEMEKEKYGFIQLKFQLWVRCYEFFRCSRCSKKKQRMNHSWC